MHLTVCLSRSAPDAAAAALVATWLLDALRGLGCDVATDGEQVVVVSGPDATLTRIRDELRLALAEDRFAGWRLG